MSATDTLVLPNAPAPDFARGSIFFVGTATVILRYGGFTVLTDPNFLHAGDQVHLGYAIHSRRRTNPALELEDVPPLDFVLLSHLHGDHIDQVVQERLDRSIPIVTTSHAAAELRRKGFRSTHALDTWQALEATKGSARVRVTAMPGKHGPGLLNALLPPVMGSLLEFRSENDRPALRLYVTGDTLVHEHLREIPRRYPEIDLALLHLGGTRLFGVMLTMDAAQGVDAIRIANPRVAIPIHYDDYPIFKSSFAEFVQAVRAAGLERRVRYLARGETYTFEVPASRLASAHGETVHA